MVSFQTQSCMLFRVNFRVNFQIRDVSNDVTMNSPIPAHALRFQIFSYRAVSQIESDTHRATGAWLWMIKQVTRQLRTRV